MSHPVAPRIGHLIVQPTPFCNIDCRYCYLPDRASKARMSLATARTVFSGIFDSGLAGARLNITWHAGEPLTLPVSYYREMVALIAQLTPPGVAVSHSLNTNATLVDDAWCDFLAEHRFGVGVSIDGPRAIHDAFRVTRAGRGTFETTLAGMKRLQAAGLAPYVISVITEAALDQADALYDFYVAEGIDRVCLNFEEQEGVNVAPSIVEASVARVDRFLRQFWNRMMADGNRLWVREFALMFREVLRPSPELPPNLLATEFGYLNVDWQGNFATYSPELLGQQDVRYGDFTLGQFGRDDLAASLGTTKAVALKAEIEAGLELCRSSCDYFMVCRGGAPSNKLAEHGRFDVAQTLACRLRAKLTADIVLEAIENTVDSAAFARLAAESAEIVV